MKCCSKEVLNLFPWSLCHTSLAQSTQHRSQRHFTTAKNHKSRTADGSKKLQIVKAASFSPSEYPAFQHASDYCDDQMVVGAVSWMMLTTHKLQNNWCPNSLWKHTRMGCSAHGCNAPLKLHFVSFKQLTGSTKGSKGEQPQQAGPQIPTIWCSSLYNGDENVQRCGGSVSLQLLDQVFCKVSMCNTCHQHSCVTSSNGKTSKETSWVICWAALDDS